MRSSPPPHWLLLIGLAISGSAGPAASASPGCPGTFLRDSQGYLASEGGAEPTDDRRKKGASGQFLYFDVMDGERHLRLSDGDEHKAKAVALKPGCKLARLRPGGTY